MEDTNFDEDFRPPARVENVSSYRHFFISFDILRRCVWWWWQKEKLEKWWRTPPPLAGGVMLIT